MILGIPITGPEMVVLGATLFAVVCFQVAVGLRWIKLGRYHYKIHKWTGISIVVFAAFHAIAGMAFALGWTIL